MHLTQVAGEFEPEVYARIDVGIGGDPASQLVQGHRVDDSAGFTTYLAGSLEKLKRAMGRGRRQQQTETAVDQALGRGPRPPPGFRGRAVPLVDLIAGTNPGRSSDLEISSSGGVVRGGGKQGLQFVTVASLVYDRARAAGLGREVPTEWFLQDIRD